MARTSRSNIGCRRFRKTSRSVSSSTLPSCDGGSNATIKNSSRRSGWDILKAGLARLPPSRDPLHCGLRIPDLRARNHSPLRRSCHHAVPAICLTRRSPAQRIRRCGLSATFRTRLQRCDGDWWPLSPRRSHVAHAAPLGTDTKICDTVRLERRHQTIRLRDRHWNPTSVASFRRRRPSPYERNAAISWHFEREPIPYALELTGRLGRRDSNLCILESGSQLGARTRTCVCRVTGAPA